MAVLTGLGGMGKSTLATRAASRLREAGFEVYGIKASHAHTPADAGRQFLYEKLLPSLARPFLVHDRPIYDAIRDGKIPVEDQVALAVAQWKKRPLALVLDNFEEVLDPESLTIAHSDLRTAYRLLTRDLTEGSRLLVTCRYFPADTPDPAGNVVWQDLKDLKEFELMKFLRRDQKAETRLRDGAITKLMIQNIHRVFGGTPGFLEQVRSVLGHADLDGWEEEIPSDTPLEEARQQYCDRILLPRLYGLLPAAGQTLASHLAVSELPLPAEALARTTVMTEAEVVPALESPVHYGLVQQFVEPGKPVLYHVSGLIRLWLTAEKRLSEPGRKMVHASLARFWKDSYERDREAELQVAIDVELFACRTHARQADLRAEFSWATVRLARGLDRHAEWKEARELLEEILEQDRDGAVWHNLASIDLNEGNYAGAREQFGKALAMRQAIGDRAGEAATWHQLASIDLEEGNYAGAREQFGKALAMRQAIGDRAGEAATWHQLATIDVHEGNYAGAREQFGKALAMRQAIGDRAGEAATWHQLASIDLRKGNYAAARDKCGKALTINQAIGNQAGEASSWHQLASIDLREGNNAAAEDKFGKALAMLQAIGDRVGEAATWHSLASIDLNEGNYAAARNKFGKALAMRQAIGDRAGEAATWHQLATIDVHEGNYAGAREQFGKALAMLQAIGDRAGEAATWHNLASIDLNEGNYAGAREQFGKALAMRQAIGDRAGEAATWHQLGFVAWGSNAQSAAIQLVAVCFLIDKAIGHGDAPTDFRTLSGMCSNLGYSQKQVDEMLQSVGESYRQDRGASLLKETFPDWQ